MTRATERQDSPGQTRGRTATKGAWREWAEAILIALVLALVIRTFIVQAFKIPSGSMIPTLEIGDHILVNKFLYGFRIPYTKIRLLPFTQPERGDVIVFVYPEDSSKDFIKRVIGVEGDEVEIRNKEVLVNHKGVNDSFARHLDTRVVPRELDPRDNFGPIRVPPRALFVMGDNRDNSRDSRYWGFVDVGMVKGKAFMIYWSWDGDHHGIRWGRIFNLIQ